MSRTTKTGRKRKDFEDPETGLPVVGLTRRPDGRWRVIGTHQTFREPDVKKAIAHFYKLIGEQKYDGLGLSPEEIEWLTTPSKEIVENNAITAISRGFALVGRTDEAWRRFWAYVASEINTRPKWVAQQTGIEWIGYGIDLKPPKPLPSFDELEKTWMKHAKCSPLQRKKVLRAWKDFTETAEINGISDITPEVVIEYQDEVHSRIIDKKDGTQGPMSGKQQAHLFTGIRRMLTFAKSRALAVDAVTKALGYLELLKPSESGVTLDPRPIEIADWRKLYAAAEGDDKALVLLMLNGAFYIKEAIELEWTDIKGDCIVTHREKTGKCVRVCVLWKETIDALSQIKRRGDKLFYTYQGLPIKVCGAFRRFADLVAAAGLETVDESGKKTRLVTPSQLRDGALTAAASANVNSQICSLLAGHRSGIADHYVKRHPKMVAPACEAVYNHYFRDEADHNGQ